MALRIVRILTFSAAFLVTIALGQAVRDTPVLIPETHHDLSARLTAMGSAASDGVPDEEEEQNRPFQPSIPETSPVPDPVLQNHAILPFAAMLIQGFVGLGASPSRAVPDAN